MYKFIYTNHKTKEVIVFIAKTIAEADEMYETWTGKHPKDLIYVGCEIKKNEM